jgi:hypothetical protein
MELFEKITWMDHPLAYIIRRELTPAATTFLTPSDFTQQIGFVVYPAGEEIKPHLHRSLERIIQGTSEVLFVKKGRCEVEIYSNAKETATRELREGDILLLVDGGHGFRMLEDTVFVEIKQGPYTGVDEKERF